MAVIVAACFVSGCKVLDPSRMMRTDMSYQFDTAEENHNEYVINVYDKLDIRVYPNNGVQLVDGGSTVTNNSNNNITGYLVESDSTVKLPILGRVNLVGMTVPDAEAMLEARYQQYYQEPFVKLSITNRRVVLFKAGSTSGTILSINNEKFTLIEALAQAGGLSDASKAYRIKILRGDIKNPKVYLYNISTLEDIRNSNLVLQSNDIIFVETRPKYIRRVLSEITPYVSLINTVLLVYMMTKDL
ncbi:MAG: polysaccharide biosynthesis/export family protein [Salinivirgaceae bacterium]|nr:polysaccharide biosynthesis/export family protein [Salinivirgaceae bacterium]